ncbi:MAG: 30S ribosomal protein S9, partial [Candidatus Nanoarchaeia archaeon]
PQMLRMKLMEPLVLAGDKAKEVNINVRTHGGGMTGQADAARLAIARALAEYHKKLKDVFLDYDRTLLVADSRRKETCKPNDSKARAKRQKSYR